MLEKSIVWSPHTKRNIHLIERVQRRATKLIFKSDSNYESRLKELNLVSLEQRRFIADVTFLYKVLNGYFNVDFSSFLNLYYPDDRYTVRSFDSLKLRTALVMIYTHLGAVLQVFWAGLVIFSLSEELPGLVNWPHYP